MFVCVYCVYIHRYLKNSFGSIYGYALYAYTKSPWVLQIGVYMCVASLTSLSPEAWSEAVPRLRTEVLSTHLKSF